MSRTKRTKDPYHFKGEPKWKETCDKKRMNSPSWFKRMKEGERRAKRNQEIKDLHAGNLEPENANNPRQPKTNNWDWF